MEVLNKEHMFHIKHNLNKDSNLYTFLYKRIGHFITFILKLYILDILIYNT